MALTAGQNDFSSAENTEDREGQPKPLRLESCLDQPEDSPVDEVVSYIPSHLPAKHYDADTTEPISCGLRTMGELLSWKRNEANLFNVATVPLALREPPLARCPRRTLVSHDMMGGYLDDRFVQGANSETPYAFYHWQYIDIFNYFTHHLVTIPPAVWTNAAHKHGVVVLGTFITEWDDGAKMCEAFLKDEESYRAVADKLVQISKYYGFDGWLINIENYLGEVAVRNMPLFLQYLTEQTRERVPGGLVLWYDSVLENGQLKWQNQLNQSNRIFFDACDGFFTNYNWTEQNLEAMKDYVGAQGRQAHIYVGVDVFARGDVVGGKFETNKALELIRKHGFSAAIFAPGWVYETHPDKSEFPKNQDKFWALLVDHLYIHRPASPLPFVSSFCRGFGKAVYWRGRCERKQSWFNLMAQEVQPLYYHMDLGAPGWLKSRGCPEDAWNGGSSLLLEGVVPEAMDGPVSAKIFSLHVPVNAEILVTLICKTSAGIKVSLEMRTVDADHCTTSDVQEVTVTSLTPAVDGAPQLMSHVSEMCGGVNPEGWSVRCSQLELRGCILRELSVLIHRDGEPGDLPFSCMLGEVMVLDVAGLQAPPDTVQGLCINDVVWLHGAGTSPETTSTSLETTSTSPETTSTSPETTSTSLCFNATLRWDYPPEHVRCFRVYWRRLRGPDPRIPPGQLQLVGRAYSGVFRVTELLVPEPPGLLELVVEPVSRTGFLVPESRWGRRRLSYRAEAAP